MLNLGVCRFPLYNTMYMQEHPVSAVCSTHSSQCAIEKVIIVNDTDARFSRGDFTRTDPSSLKIVHSPNITQKKQICVADPHAQLVVRINMPLAVGNPMMHDSSIYGGTCGSIYDVLYDKR